MVVVKSGKDVNPLENLLIDADVCTWKKAYLTYLLYPSRGTTFQDVKDISHSLYLCVCCRDYGEDSACSKYITSDLIKSRKKDYNLK